MKSVIWSAGSRADLRRIFAFNEDRSLGWALRVDERIWERGISLGQFPDAGRPVKGVNQRKLSIPDIQYVITYRIVDDQVTIIRIESTREIA